MEAADRRVWLLAAGGVAAVALLSWQPVTHGDTFIYAATGRWVVDHHTVPRADPFSWTVGGQIWQSNGWAWGLALWGAHVLGGLAGMAALKPLLVVGLGVTSGFAARALGARTAPAAASAVLAPLLVVPWITERPQMASYVLFPLALGVAARAWRDGLVRPGWLAAVAAVFVLWANVHSVVLFGVLVTASMAVAVALVGVVHERSARPIVAPAAVVLVAGVATLLNPWGLGLVTHSLEVRRLSSSTMTEWYPLARAGAIGWLPVAVTIAAAAVVVATRGWRRPDLLVPLVVCAAFTVDAIRSAPFLSIGAAVLCAPMVPALDSAAVRARRHLATVGVVAALGVALALSASRIIATGDPAADVPVNSTAALPEGCRLRNDYRLGGWVIFERPELAVSADGRNDLYGIDGYDQNRWFEEPDAAAAAPRALSAEGTTCVLARPDSQLVRALFAAGWREVEADGAGVALVAPADANPTGR